jgi:hypothetical protein
MDARRRMSVIRTSPGAADPTLGRTQRDTPVLKHEDLADVATARGEHAAQSSVVAMWRAFGFGRAGAADAQQIEAAARAELTQAPRGVRSQSALTPRSQRDPADADGIAVDHPHGARADRLPPGRI